MAKNQNTEQDDDLTGEAAAPLGEGDRTRIPFGTPSMRFDVPLKLEVVKKWHFRWVNEENINRAEKAGYRFATKDDVSYIGAAETVGDGLGAKIRQGAGRYEDGRTQHAYLMKADRALIEQDMADHERKFNKAIEDQILEGRVVDIGSENPDAPNRVAVDTRFGKRPSAAR